MTTDPEPTPVEETPADQPEKRSAFDGPVDLSLEVDEAPSTEDASKEPTAKTKSELEQLREENAQLKDQTLRALAEVENIRRRSERDRDDAGKYAISNFARTLLPVADNLRRAIEAVPANLRAAEGPISAVMVGIEATERELLSSFEKVGIQKINALDLPFNPNQHEVMLETPGTGKPQGIVVQVVEDGYMIHGRLLRPARVAIAKADPGAAPTSHTVDTQA